MPGRFPEKFRLGVSVAEFKDELGVVVALRQEGVQLLGFRDASVGDCGVPGVCRVWPFF